MFKDKWRASYVIVFAVCAATTTVAATTSMAPTTTTAPTTSALTSNLLTSSPTQQCTPLDLVGKALSCALRMDAFTQNPLAVP